MWPSRVSTSIPRSLSPGTNMNVGSNVHAPLPIRAREPVPDVGLGPRPAREREVGGPPREERERDVLVEVPRRPPAEAGEGLVL